MMNKKTRAELIAHLVFDAKNETENTVIDTGKKKIKVSCKERLNAINRLLDTYMVENSQAYTHKDKTLTVNCFSSSSTLPSLNVPYRDTPPRAFADNFDQGWNAAFRTINLGPGKLTWQIDTVKDNTGFVLVKEGEEITFKSVEGDYVTGKCEKYGRGFQATWEMIYQNELYRFVERLIDTRNKVQTLFANAHYGVLGSAAAANITATYYQDYLGVTEDPVIARDTTTLNEATVLLGETNKDKDFGDIANIQMLLYAHPGMRARITKALNQSFASESAEVVLQPIFPIYTYNSYLFGELSTKTAFLVLPGRAITNAIVFDEKRFMRENPLNLSKELIYWVCFGAMCGDAQQILPIYFED